MLRIKQARLLLNGKYRDGSKATFGSNFKFTRYAIVLLAAISMSNFEYHTKKIQNATFISYYNLYKVAKFLGIEFERTKSAPYVYNELVDRGRKLSLSSSYCSVESKIKWLTQSKSPFNLAA